MLYCSTARSNSSVGLMAQEVVVAVGAVRLVVKLTIAGPAGVGIVRSEEKVDWFTKRFSRCSLQQCRLQYHKVFLLEGDCLRDVSPDVQAPRKFCCGSYRIRVVSNHHLHGTHITNHRTCIGTNAGLACTGLRHLLKSDCPGGCFRKISGNLKRRGKIEHRRRGRIGMERQLL